MKLLFATNNHNKIKEIQAAIGNIVEVIGLKDAGIHIDIPEPHDTLEKNASEKSSVIYAMTAMSCFSEDTGLEIEALNGEPGVKSARYSGGSSEDNIDKVLEKMRDIENRRAQFRTVISLIWDGKEYLFEGICPGIILSSRKGAGGFGYDPIFIPDGSEWSFGEMDIEQKNVFSHRKKAAALLVSFLQKQNSPGGAAS
jgi:XTP/dITP diphosphohydrolase